MRSAGNERSTDQKLSAHFMCRKVSNLPTGQSVMYLPQRKTVALSICRSETRDINRVLGRPTLLPRGY